MSEIARRETCPSLLVRSSDDCLCMKLKVTSNRTGVSFFQWESCFKGQSSLTDNLIFNWLTRLSLCQIVPFVGDGMDTLILFLIAQEACKKFNIVDEDAESPQSDDVKIWSRDTFRVEPSTHSTVNGHGLHKGERSARALRFSLSSQSNTRAS